MIAHIRGTLERKTPDRVLLDVGGIGYEIQIPASTYSVLPEVGSNKRLHTHLYVREDALILYGFSSVEELEFFRLLLSVSRIGPNVSLTILSGISFDEFRSAIHNEDIGRLSSLSGVGTKTAKRLVLELKDRIGAVSVNSGHPHDLADAAIAGMISLGYARSVAEIAVRSALQSESGGDVEAILKAALRNV
ncbi:MAG TPA: Holliday junction branch migration protein RuvA [Methanosarcinales archaeon]|nr:Holliday junction branch migration protein RuvA [Methanosarcinales archaeon]